MPEPATPTDEARRISALQTYDILDTLPEKAYDDSVRIASTSGETPSALVSFVDAERQFDHRIVAGFYGGNSALPERFAEFRVIEFRSVNKAVS